MESLPCIRCGEQGHMVVDADTAEMHCNDCNDDYDISNVEAVFAKWQPIIAWVKSHPNYVEPSDVKADV